MTQKELLKYFFAWRVVLLLFLFLAIQIVPLQFDFLGGGISNYLQKPYLWAWADFDGVHYLRIAEKGYAEFLYFFFPLYPLLIRIVAPLFGGGTEAFLFSGLAISHLALFFGIVGLIKLLRLDYEKDLTGLVVLLILVFPTSFYFGSVYSESLFFLLSIWAFYFARKGRWIVAGLMGAFSSASRIVGVALFPAFIVEAITQMKRKNTHPFLPVVASFFTLFGFFSYAVFLDEKVGDPLAFFHSLGRVFGEQRSEYLVILPRVFYRYIFKILPSLNYSYFPGVFTAWLEFLTGVIFVILSVLGLLASLGKLGKVKIAPSYAVYLFLGYLIPTFSGSFSSLPRYVLVIFPGFIILASYLIRLPPITRFVVVGISLILLSIATSLFTRGYWLA